MTLMCDMAVDVGACQRRGGDPDHLAAALDDLQPLVEDRILTLEGDGNRHDRGRKTLCPLGRRHGRPRARRAKYGDLNIAQVGNLS